MANAVENALNRASDEQRARAYQVIEEARQNIRLVSSQQLEDISPAGGDTIARNAQIIEEAKRTIPFETMKDVDSIDPPLNTPSNRAYYNSAMVEIHPDTQANIERIGQGPGNNHLNENAVDRAMQRPAQELSREQEQQSLGR